MIAVVVIAEEMPRGPDACSLIYATACRQYEIVKSPVLLLIAGSVTSATSGHQRAGKQAQAGRQAGRQAGELSYARLPKFVTCRHACRLTAQYSSGTNLDLPELRSLAA